MLLTLILGICLICGVAITPLKYRNITNTIYLFVLEWIVVMFLAKQKMYGLYDVSASVEQIVLIGCISFLCGHIVSIIFRKYRFVAKRDSSNGTSYSLRYEMLYVLGIVCVLYFLPQFVKALGALLSGSSMNAIRLLVQDETSGFSSGSKIKNLVSNFIVLPSATALEALCVADFWAGKRDKKLLVITATIVLFRIVSDAGRTPLVNLAMYLIFGYLVTHKKREIKNNKTAKKDRKLVKRCSVIGLGIILLISLARTSSTLSRQLYFYFAMSPVLFSQWKEVVDSANLVTYGLTSLNGYFFSIVYLVRNLFGLNYPELLQSSYDMIAATDSVWKSIAQGGISANAYISAFWFMYTDYRMIGVIIGMLCYGYIVSRTYFKLINQKNVYHLAMYLLLLQGVMFSFIRFPFAKPYYALAFIIIYLACRKRECIDDLR